MVGIFSKALAFVDAHSSFFLPVFHQQQIDVAQKKIKTVIVTEASVALERSLDFDSTYLSVEECIEPLWTLIITFKPHLIYHSFLFF